MTIQTDMRFGETIDGALRSLDADGYTKAFRPSGPGLLTCLACQAENDARHIRLHDLVRVEGMSDPSDESVIAALECPSCHARGTAVLTFGPAGSPEEAEIFRALKDHRERA